MPQAGNNIYLFSCLFWSLTEVAGEAGIKATVWGARTGILGVVKALHLHPFAQAHGKPPLAWQENHMYSLVVCYNIGLYQQYQDLCIL